MSLLLLRGHICPEWRCCRSHARLSLLDGRDQQERGDQVEGSQDEQKQVREWPVDAETLARPERAKGGEHDANNKLQGVLRDALEGSPHQGPDQDYQQAGRGRTQSGQANAVSTATAKGNDDEGHFEPFQQHRLVGEYHSERIEAPPSVFSPGASLCQIGCIDGLFVVQQLESTIALNRIFEPFEAKEQEQEANHET